MTAVPMRTCLGCRERCPRSALLRVALEAGGGHSKLVVDEGARFGGRGAWVHPEPQCVSRALARAVFPRALRVEGPLDAGDLEAWCADRAGVKTHANRGKRVQRSMDTSR